MPAGYALNFRVLLPDLPRLESGAALTLEVSALALVLSLPLGLGGALLRRSRWRGIRTAVTAMVELLRNLPLLILLYVLFFVLPAHGLRLTAFQAGVLGLTLNSAAFTTEIFRGGLTAIPRGQHEAAAALGLHRWRAFQKVTLPQLLRIVFPAMGNQVVSVVLGSAQVAIIGVPELTYQALSIGSDSFRYLEVFAVAGVFYIVCVQLINAAWRLGARRVAGRAVTR